MRVNKLFLLLANAISLFLAPCFCSADIVNVAQERLTGNLSVFEDSIAGQTDTKPDFRRVFIVNGTKNQNCFKQASECVNCELQANYARSTFTRRITSKDFVPSDRGMSVWSNNRKPIRIELAE